MHLKLSGKIIQANTAETLAPPGIFMDFNSGPKVPFPGFLDIGQFHSPPLGGLFYQFPYCSGYQARRVHHFPDFNLGSFFTFKNIFIVKNPTDFGKTVEIGADPFQPNCPLNLSLQCLVECWRVIVEVELFYYELLRLSLVKVERLQNNCLRL